VHRSDVVAVAERREASGVRVDDDEVVLGMERIDQRPADVPGPEHDDVHGRQHTDARGARTAKMGHVRTLLSRRRRHARALGVDVAAALSVVGVLLRPLGLAYLAPAVLAVGYGEPAWPFLVAGAATSGAGAVLTRATRGSQGASPREGYLVVALLWFAVAVFGTIPYLIHGEQYADLTDALFESMSGFSTTGATVATDLDALPRSLAMWRQFSEWIGGLGIIVLFLAVLPRLNVGGRQALFHTEMPGPEIGLETTIRESARRFVVLYVAITVVLVAVLALLGLSGVDDRMTLYNAVAHGLTTVATGGFSPEARSIEPFAAPTQWVLALFMIVAGTNFALLFAGVVRRRPAALARDEEFRAYLALLAAATAVVVVALVTDGAMTGGDAIRHGFFNTVSMMTTTGYASADFNQWPALATLVLIGVTLLSASAGSTSGSIKLVRHVVIAKMLRRELRHTVNPELIAPLRMNGSVIGERTLRAMIVFVLLFLGIGAVGAVAILFDSALHGIELGPYDALAASAAALSGAGPSLGFAGPMGSYEPFSDVSKLVLIAEMYLGRLELVPVLVIFARSYWRA
jgi:trk system potassium uptake protein TrkH